MTQESLENQVREALKSAADVRDAVHGITLKALSGGSLDTAAIKQVVGSVMSGVGKGAAGLGSSGAKAVGEALKGLDDAVAGAAKATQFAVQEAAGRVGDFSRNELQQRFEEMKALETTFLDTLRHGANEAGGVVAETARQFAEHAKVQGSAVGRQVEETLPKLSEVARAQLDAGVHTLRSGSAMLAGMAAGMLSGLADRLQPSERPPENAAPAASTADAKPNQTP